MCKEGNSDCVHDPDIKWKLHVQEEYWSKGTALSLLFFILKCEVRSSTHRKYSRLNASSRCLQHWQ